MKFVREKHIELIESDNTIQKLSKKDNCFAIAIIKKYDNGLYKKEIMLF